MKIANVYLKACLLILGFLSFSCNEKMENQATKNTSGSEMEPKVQSVEVVKPKKRSFNSELLITGAAMPNKKVTIFAMEQGYLKKIKAEIGDRIKKGDTIAVLINPELQRKKDQLKAQLKLKESTYERLKSISDKTPALTTRQQLENAESEYTIALSEIKSINDQIEFLSVKAPFAGLITQRFVDVGALIQSGLNQSNPQPIVEIQQTNPVRLTVPLPEADVGLVQKGMQVNVTFPELAGGSYEAKISRMSQALDASSKTMMVEIDINNANYKIVSGMYAKVLIQTSSRENVLSLPIIAKTMYNDEPHALVVINDKVERIRLRVGLSNKKFFEVLNPEINQESLVIVQGKSLVKPGQQVNSVVKQL